jgi:hypothetical protein
MFCNGANRLFEFLGLLRTNEQFHAVFENQLHTVITADIVRPATADKAVPDAPSAVFPDWLISPGITLTQIIQGKLFEMNMKGNKSYIQTVRADLRFHFQKEKKNHDSNRHTYPGHHGYDIFRRILRKWLYQPATEAMRRISALLGKILQYPFSSLIDIILSTSRCGCQSIRHVQVIFFAASFFIPAAS